MSLYDSSLFFIYCSGSHRDLHSFPTRRSSDLVLCSGSSDAPTRAFAVTTRARIEMMRSTLNICEAQRSGAVVTVLSRSEEHTSELQSRRDLVCRLLLEKKKYTA